MMRAGIGGAAFYAVLYAAVALGHRSFIFPRQHSGLEPSLEGAEMWKLDANGEPAVGLFAPPRDQQPVVVFFHGNGDELVDTVPLARRLRDEGLGVLFAEYPGFGVASQGTASEATIYATAARLLDELRARGFDGDRVVLVGHSLGTGVAVELATRGYGGRMILISPYTSMVDMVGRFMPILPVSTFVRDRFDNLAKGAKVTIPTLVVHGDRDMLIPLEMGREIAGGIAGAKLEVIEGGSHNDLFRQKDDKLLRLIVSFSMKEGTRAGALPREGEAAPRWASDRAGGARGR
ncbi:MAG: alpha/beta fold hydrolase [Polyangiaceae bacterium]|nr:alpha/beta fold hydrolase [Polyangiaceae bacterium]